MGSIYLFEQAMSDDSKPYREVVDRRQFLRVAGVSGAAALAGCTGDDGSGTPTPLGDDTDTDSGGDGTDTATSTPAAQVYDTTLVGATNNGVPANLHLNPMGTQNYDDVAGQNVFERFAAYNFANQEFEMAGLESWEIEGKTVTLTIREDLNWDNGEPVTARDLITQFRIQKKLGSTLWDFAESVEQGDDEKTVVINLSNTSNPTIIKHTIGAQSARIHGYHPVYKEFLDKEAADVQQFKWEGDVVGSGSFKVGSKDKQAWNLERNEEYYNADRVNFTDYQLLSRNDNTALQQGLMGDELDVVYSLFAPPNVVKSFPDHVSEINTPAKWGYGIVFNHEDEHFGKRAVRQAVAHVINRDAVAKNAGPRTKYAPPVVTAIPPNDQERWLGDSIDQFESYGMAASQNEQAASLLRDAGYTKEDGTWQDGDGNTLGGSYITPAGWTDWTTATNTVVDQLNQFGFDFEITSKPAGDYFGGYAEGNFTIGAFYWLPGGARSSFPYFPLRWQMTCPDIGGGHGFPEGEKTVPAMSGSGEMTLDPLEEIKQVATMQDEAEVEDTIRRVAWHHNQNLPFLGVVAKWEQSWVSSKDWNVAEKGDPARKVKWPPHWLPRRGKLSATGE